MMSSYEYRHLASDPLEVTRLKRELIQRDADEIEVNESVGRMLAAYEADLIALRRENARLVKEVAALRLSLTGVSVDTKTEPLGCPCPGACSALKVVGRNVKLEGVREAAMEVSTRYLEGRLTKAEIGKLGRAIHDSLAACETEEKP